MSLDRMQVDALLRPIAGARVSKDGKGFSHVQAYDVRRRLIEILGFGGWSGEVVDTVLVYEDEHTLLRKDKRTKEPIPGSEYQAWTVTYRCTYRLTVLQTGAVYTEAATGTATNQPDRADAHDLALKTAESQAFKRAAVNLGNQMGLSLYDNGSVGPFVRYVLGPDPARLLDDGTIQRPEKPELAETGDHVASPLAPEDPTDPAPGGEEAPPVADSSPAQDEKSTTPAVERGGAQTRRSEPEEPTAGAFPVQLMLRDEVDAIMRDQDLTGQQRKSKLTKVLMRANEAGVKNATVGDGRTAQSLEAYIHAAIGKVGR